MSSRSGAQGEAANKPGLGQVSIEFDCQALTDHARSEVDARVRADLAVRPAGGGMLTIVCDAAGATVTWSPQDEEARVATVELPQDPDALSDRLLEVIANLLDDRAKQPLPAHEGAEDPRVPAAPLPEQRPRRLGPVARIPEPKRPLLWLVAGLGGEFWSPFAAAVAGPRAGLSVAPVRRLALTSTVGWAWGVALPDELSSVTAISAQMAADAAVDPQHRFEVGLGATASRLDIQAAGNLSPETQRTVAVAALLRVRYAARFETLDVLVGPELRGRFGAVRVEVNGSEALKIPELTLGLGIDAAWCLCWLEGGRQ